MDKKRVFKRLQPEDDAFVCLAYYMLVGGVGHVSEDTTRVMVQGVVTQYIAKRE